MAFVLGVVTQRAFLWRPFTCNVCNLQTTETLFFYGSSPVVEAETLPSVFYIN